MIADCCDCQVYRQHHLFSRDPHALHIIWWCWSCESTGQQNLHHHHHHILFALFTQCKKLFTAVITRRRGDSGSHRAYGRATSKHKVGNEIFLCHYIVTWDIHACTSESKKRCLGVVVEINKWPQCAVHSISVVE